MEVQIVWCAAISLLVAGHTDGEIQQPPSFIVEKGASVRFQCKKSNNHDAMYWYQQQQGKGPQLLYFSRANIPDSEQKETNDDRFSAQRLKFEDFDLSISSVEMEDSATYFCASSRGGYSEAHFGKGTRLTVLEEGQITSPPKVTIFAPSEEEVKEKQKATIVCLATNFFPDHVSLTWYLNDEVRTDGVKTETPQYDKTKKEYSLISRIRITIKEWQNSNNKFRCNVEFYDENGKSDYSDEIFGRDCDGGSAAAKETYLKRANLGKLVYILLIFKSTLYGAFVMVLKLRKKVVP
nr:PREDICTED: T-cell receptor beta-1 chain C region [Anolis carolinensis]|eukprot:XP_016852964.1 PREDICTED: T-cell receptor beta-1 chain C region [Anolis carolinensis]